MRAKDRALPKVVAAGLRAVVNKQQVDFRSIQNSVDEGMLEIIPKLQARTNYLAMLANIATLLGLLGTIYGLIVAFRAISAPGIDASEKARLLAAGISHSHEPRRLSVVHCDSDDFLLYVFDQSYRQDHR